MPPYTQDPRINQRLLEARIQTFVASPSYAEFQKQADKQVVIKQEAIVLEDLDEEKAEEGKQPSFGVIKSILSCEICKNVPMLPIMQCDHCAAFYCERCLTDFNCEQHGIQVPSEQPTSLPSKEAEAPKNERERRKQADDLKQEKDRQVRRFKKQLRCKTCHKHLKVTGKKGDKGEDSDEMEKYVDANGDQRERIKNIRYSSRIARNLLRHLEFTHTCEDGGEEQVMSYEEFVRHARFSCTRIREFKCQEPGCSSAEVMSKAELEEHLACNCDGMQVACLVCKVTLPGAEFSSHNCLEHQITSIRQLRAQAAELARQKEELSSELSEAKVLRIKAQKVRSDIQEEERRFRREARNAEREIQTLMKAKLNQGIEKVSNLIPFKPPPAYYIKKAEAKRKIAEKQKRQQAKKARKKMERQKRDEKKKVEEPIDFGNLFEENSEPWIGADEAPKQQAQDPQPKPEPPVATATSVIENPELEEKEPVLEDFMEAYEEEEKDESVNLPLIPYSLSRSVSSATNSIYAYNEERHPYQTYFYKTLDYHDDAIQSKFVAIRKHRNCFARSYIDFHRPMVMRGIGIKSANCCPMMDPVELLVVARVPEKFEFKKEFCDALEPFAHRIGIGPNDFNGMMLVKHIKDIGFSSSVREEQIDFRFDKAIMSTSLHFFVLSTKQSLSSEPSPHQGVQFKRIYVYQ